MKLSDRSHSTYPQTPVYFPPVLVGYDSAQSRAQWEQELGDDPFGHWASGHLQLYSEWHTMAFGENAAGVKCSHRLGLFVTETEGWVRTAGGMWKRQDWHA